MRSIAILLFGILFFVGCSASDSGSEDSESLITQKSEATGANGSFQTTLAFRNIIGSVFADTGAPLENIVVTFQLSNNQILVQVNPPGGGQNPQFSSVTLDPISLDNVQDADTISLGPIILDTVG